MTTFAADFLPLAGSQWPPRNSSGEVIVEGERRLDVQELYRKGFFSPG